MLGVEQVQASAQVIGRCWSNRSHGRPRRQKVINRSSRRGYAGAAERGQGSSSSFPGGAAALQVLVGRPGLGQWVALSDPDVQLTGGDRGVHRGRTGQQLLPGGDVVVELGSGEEHRAGGVQPLRVERRHRSAGRAEQHQDAALAQAGQAGVERGAPDAVVGGGHPDTAGQLAHLGGQVVDLGVADHLGRAGRAGQLLLLRGGHGGDHAGSEPGGELGEQQPDPAGGRVHQHVLAGLHRVCVVHQEVRGHALQTSRRRPPRRTRRRVPAPPRRPGPRPAPRSCPGSRPRPPGRRRRTR